MISKLRKNTMRFARKVYDKLPGTLQASIYRQVLLKRIDKDQLPSLYLETTSACNLNCVMCPTQRPIAKKHKTDGYMDFELFRKLVDEYAEKAPSGSISLHKDGEPLLHPEILKFIEYASSKHNNVILVTNSTLLDDEMSTQILKTNLQNIRFSIDGFDEKTFNKIRVQSPNNPYADSRIAVDYPNVLRNVMRFCELRDELGNDNIRIGVRCTSFGPTKEQISDYKEFWKSKVDFVDIVDLLTWSGTVQGDDEQDERSPCLNLWGHMVVNWDGTMGACCTYVDTNGDKKGILGDLNYSTLEESWQGMKIQELRLAHLDNEISDIAPYCVGCKDWETTSPPSNVLWNQSLTTHLKEKVYKETPALKK